jgi:hypothetical protein
MELGVAGGGKNAKAGEVDVAVPTEEKDINAIYAAELKRLAQPAEPEVKTKSPTQKQEDYYKVSRSRCSVLDTWVDEILDRHSERIRSCYGSSPTLVWLLVYCGSYVTEIEQREEC